MPRNWCKKCQKEGLKIFQSFKDFNYRIPNDITGEANEKQMIKALDWTRKKGISREIPGRKQQIHPADIRRYRLLKRKNRFLHCDETILRRREGPEIDEAFESYLNRRDPEGDLHIMNWAPKLNPIFTKQTNNTHRCGCDKNTPVGTIRQYVLHTIASHSHIQGKEVECVECAAQGYRNKFVSPQAMWRHLNNSHEKLMIIGHLRVQLQPDFQSINDTDRWLQAYSQMLVAATIETLHQEGSLTDSFFLRERKEEDEPGSPQKKETSEHRT